MQQESIRVTARLDQSIKQLKSANNDQIEKINNLNTSLNEFNVNVNINIGSITAEIELTKIELQKEM